MTQRIGHPLEPCAHPDVFFFEACFWMLFFSGEVALINRFEVFEVPSRNRWQCLLIFHRVRHLDFFQRTASDG